MLIKMEFGAFYYISRQGSAVHLSNGGNRVFSIRQYKAVISFSLKEQILRQPPNSLSSRTRAALKLSDVFAAWVPWVRTAWSMLSWLISHTPIMQLCFQIFSQNE